MRSASSIAKQKTTVFLMMPILCYVVWGLGRFCSVIELRLNKGDLVWSWQAQDGDLIYDDSTRGLIADARGSFFGACHRVYLTQPMDFTFPILGPLPEAKWLDFVSCRVSNRDLEKASKISGLERLALSDCRIANLAESPPAAFRFEYLDLLGSSLDESALLYFRQVSTVRALMVSETLVNGKPITAKQVRGLIDDMGVEDINVTLCGFSVDELSLICGARTLKTVTIDPFQFSEAKIQSLKKSNPDIDFNGID